MKKNGFLAGLLLLCSYSFAGDPQYFWNSASVTFRIQGLGGDPNFEDAFEEAVNRWNDTPASVFVQVDRTSYADPCTESIGLSVSVRFKDDNCGEAWGSTTLGVSRAWYSTALSDQITANGEIAYRFIDADIVFNSVFAWTAYDGNWTSTPDFRRVALHEIGHSIGLGHTSVSDSIMFPTAGNIYLPRYDDVETLTYIYGVDLPYKLNLSNDGPGETVVAPLIPGTGVLDYRPVNGTILWGASGDFVSNLLDCPLESCSVDIQKGLRLLISAVPDTGAIFVKWAENTLSKDLVTFPYFNDISLTAIFSADSDNDGTYDFYDVFPNDPLEASDTDGDGVGDNRDVYPTIPIGGLLDTDNDGAPNICDAVCLAAGMQADADTSDFVTRFYLQILNRSPDDEGLNNWVNSLANQTLSGKDIAYGFIFSAEFFNRNTSNSDYVSILYRAFFNREPDSSGFNNWLSLLEGGASRKDILDGFLGSIEFSNLANSFGIAVDLPLVKQFVKRFYVQVLQREADGSGLTYWSDRLTSGELSASDVAFGFVFSQEFLNRNLSNSDYLAVLYRAFFNREPDESGFNNWLNALENGSSRSQVLDGFLGSGEFSVLAEAYGIVSI